MAQAFDFIPAIPVGSVLDRPAPARFRTLLGLEVCDLEWDEALHHVRSQINRDGRRTVVSFLDTVAANQVMVDPAYRDRLSTRLVLPAGPGADMAARTLTGAPFAENLSAAAFIPSFLTYVAEPMRIGVIGLASVELTEAVARLQAHAPWHRFHGLEVDSFDQDAGTPWTPGPSLGKLDLLIVATHEPEQDLWIERNVLPEQASLVIASSAILDQGKDQGRGRTVGFAQFLFHLSREWMRGKTHP